MTNLGLLAALLGLRTFAFFGNSLIVLAVLCALGAASVILGCVCGRFIQLQIHDPLMVRVGCKRAVVLDQAAQYRDHWGAPTWLPYRPVIHEVRSLIYTEGFVRLTFLLQHLNLSGIRMFSLLISFSTRVFHRPFPHRFRDCCAMGGTVSIRCNSFRIDYLQVIPTSQRVRVGPRQDIVVKSRTDGAYLSGWCITYLFTPFVIC